MIVSNRAIEKAPSSNDANQFCQWRRVLSVSLSDFGGAARRRVLSAPAGSPKELRFWAGLTSLPCRSRVVEDLLLSCISKLYADVSGRPPDALDVARGALSG